MEMLCLHPHGNLAKPELHKHCIPAEGANATSSYFDSQ